MSGPRILVVGSGPIGATFARRLIEDVPTATVLMVEAGPQLTSVPGESVRNIVDPEERAAARRASQGPASHSDTPAGLGIPGGTVVEGTYTARMGTHLVDFGGNGSGHAPSFPAAALATCVGGQGAHWTAATPRPAFSEKIPFIPDDEWEHLVSEAESLLHTTKDPFRGSAIARALRSAVAEEFDPQLPDGYKTHYLPVAGDLREDGSIRWAGTDVVFGPLVQEGSEESRRFELRSLTIARRISVKGDRVTGVLLEDARTGEQELVLADVVVIAADAFRTPQLLWASDIRPVALGRYLTDHTGLFSIVALDPRKMSRFAAVEEVLGERAIREEVSARHGSDPVAAAVKVPFCEPAHPYSSQIMYMDRPVVPLPEGHPLANNPWGYANVSFGGRKYPRPEDGLLFDDAELDWMGFPTITVEYELTAKELSELDGAMVSLQRAAAALGEFIPQGAPRRMPAGASLHYKGTIRMGTDDEGTSVCDPWSRVWRFENLYVGGNGTIPTATVANPTLMSVAIAIRSARSIASGLAGRARPDRTAQGVAA